MMEKYSNTIAPIFENASSYPENIAFIFKDEKITYKELEISGRRAAHKLKDMGVEKGVRVAIISGNSPDIIIVYLGLAILGAVIVPINNDYGESEIRYILEHSQSEFFIHSELLKRNAERAIEQMGCKPKLENLDEFKESLSNCEIYNDDYIGGGDDLVLLCYTSGTTSTPKGVACTHANELVSAFAYKKMWGVKTSDSMLITLPLTFAYGFHAAAYVALVSGATILLSEKFHPGRALESIESQSPTIFLGVPTMYAMMLDFAKKDGRRFNTSSLRLAAASGAALTEQTIEDCREVLGINVRPYYAMTEVKPIFCFDIDEPADVKPGSVGKLISPTEVKIVDPNGEEVVGDRPGELLVKGPSYSGAYYKDPERTQSAMEGEWFKTGDLVSRDSDGYYYIVGRLRDQIISGGAKIAPIEVENALLSHPGIAEAAVLGSPDPIFGQTVKAVIVKADEKLTVEDVQEYCRGVIAEYKVPRIVVFLEELPLTPAGKLLKSALLSC